jgi:polyisoprenoid-binding protein YceI
MKLMITIATLLMAAVSFASNIDTKESKFTWKASKKMGSFHTGEIFLKSAKAELKGDKIVAGEFEMDMASFTNTDLTGEWKTKFMDHVKSGDFFEVSKYPTAKLVIDGMPSKNTVSGKLTIKDKTEPVTVTFEKAGNAYNGTFKFDRTKFGITYGSENFFKSLVADKVINNEIELTFKVVVK